MTDHTTSDSMLDVFLFETSQLLEQLECIILSCEKSDGFDLASVNDIFRIMHTIKGSSAMMAFNSISLLAHSIEDLFYYLREEKTCGMDCSTISDLVLEGVDFIKVELIKIKNHDKADGNPDLLIVRIKDFLAHLKKGDARYAYKAVLRFAEGCEMENIRAYSVIHHLHDLADEMYYKPEDILDNDKSVDAIRRDGFEVSFTTEHPYDKIHDFFMQTLFLSELQLDELQQNSDLRSSNEGKTPPDQNDPDNSSQISNDCSELKGVKENQNSSAQQSIISVSVSKLDRLMDLVGEMVIAEAMVVQNPDLKGLELGSFLKAARQLNKITGELQDLVMAIRMVSLSTTFHKMHRVVRDMSRKLNKEVELEIIGEETEVDKNIIERISDPLMHLVRNAIDHGIESADERRIKNKPSAGTITLEAKNSGSDVHIIIKDDGKGLDKDKIIKKAKENGLLYKSEEEMTEQEIFNLILLPGFSTKEAITEFSGRGVGMDVVTRNIETIGGSVSVESVPCGGTSITLKIPLTLAIIDGMNIKVGNSRFTLPTISIKESFRPKEDEIITDPDGNEMIMVRGECYPILRLHEFYKIRTKVIRFSEGIIVMLEQDGKALCIFADELIGQQQVVVKTLPQYIRKFRKIRGLAGCTLLGDGSISLIIDIGGLMRF